jgi:hypothetical protein
MSGWYGPGWRPQVLTTPSLDLAVAWGAAAYGWLRHSGGRRIGGGIARAYYVGVESPLAAASGLATVLCVVPRHLEEEHEIVLSSPELDLTLGAPVLFSLFTSTVRDEQAGEVLHVKPDQLLALPSLSTILRAGKRGGGGPKHVPVTLAAKCTAVGTLEIHCVAKDGGTRWRLEFNTREIVKTADEAEELQVAAATDERTRISEVVPEAVVQSAARLIDGTFADEGSEPEPKELVRALESATDAGRDHWPTGLCRRLADRLIEVADGRTRSAAHRSRWFNLLGFTLRPGYGDPMDRFRLVQLWKHLHAPKPGGSAPAPESGADVWIMWRRVAGGVPTAWQQTLSDRVRPFVLPGKGRAAVRPGANEMAEMWRAVAALERLDTKLKAQLGDVLVKQVRSPRRPPTYAFWSLTRLGARVLLDGPLNCVVHPEIASAWIDAVVGFEPSHESDTRDWAFCLANLARRSGQRALDVDESRRRTVLATLRGLSIPDAWRRMVEDVVVPEASDRDRLFGEALPVGLRLR